jgi:uncharacterized protein involved in exopolysaccharide biosynthesis
MNDFPNVTTAPEELDEAIEVEEIDADDTEPLSLKIARMLRWEWSQRRTVIKIVLAGIVISFIYAITKPNAYTSRTTLMPPGNSSPFSNLLSMPGASVSTEALGLESPGELYVAILQSRNVQDGLLTRFNLMQYYRAHFSGDARLALIGATSIDEDVKSGVITVSVIDKSPAMAADLANGYVAELNRVLTEGSTSSARRERIFLEGRLQGVKKDLDEASKALSQFSTKSKTIDIENQAKSMVDSGFKLQGDLIEARGELAALRQIYSEDNARVKSAEARIAELQRQVTQMGGFSATNGSPTEQSKALYPSAAELPTLGLTYTDLERRVKVDGAVWESLTQQYEVARVAEAKEIPTVRVLDVGAVPEKKTAPFRALIMLVGTMLSLVIGCLAVVGLKAWREMDSQNEMKQLVQDVIAYISKLIRPSKWTNKGGVVVE